MGLIQNVLRLSALSAALILVGCGRSGSLNQTTMPLPTPQTNSGASSFMSPVNQTSGNSQAMPGGRAVATASGGYVYEQNPAANNTAYNYYNQQNPCLFPQAGQQSACQGGSNAYYGGSQTPQSTGAYPQYAAPATNNYAGSTYPAQTGAYPQQGSAYPQQGSAYPQSGSTYAPQNSGYAQNPNTYAQNTYAPATYPANNQNTAYNSYRAPATAAPVNSGTASKAQSRINPNAVSSTSSDPNKKISF